MNTLVTNFMDSTYNSEEAGTGGGWHGEQFDNFTLRPVHRGTAFNLALAATANASNQVFGRTIQAMPRAWPTTATKYRPSATDLKDWKRHIRTAKSCGANLFRFHSYCPPEGAFETDATESGDINHFVVFDFMDIAGELN